MQIMFVYVYYVLKANWKSQKRTKQECFFNDRMCISSNSHKWKTSHPFLVSFLNILSPIFYSLRVYFTRNVQFIERSVRHSHTVHMHMYKLVFTQTKYDNIHSSRMSLWKRYKSTDTARNKCVYTWSVKMVSSADAKIFIHCFKRQTNIEEENINQENTEMHEETIRDETRRA